MVPVVRVKTVEEAIDHCNANNLALQGCVFSRDIDQGRPQPLKTPCLVYCAFHELEDFGSMVACRENLSRGASADDHQLADLFVSLAAIRVSDAMETGTVQVSMTMYSGDTCLDMCNAQSHTCAGPCTVP